MTVDNGNRNTFNNIAVHGTQLPLAVEENFVLQYSVYPNPVADVINIVGVNTAAANYKLYTIDGKQVKSGILENAQINLSDLSKGLYLLQLESEGKTEIKKISKK